MAQTRRLKLRYTRPALADLRSILDYIAAQSPDGARRAHARIKTVIDLLLLHPYLGHRTSDPTIRRLAATPYPYLIFYEISETEIIIMRFGTRLVIPQICRVPADLGSAAADGDQSQGRRYKGRFSN